MNKRLNSIVGQQRLLPLLALGFLAGTSPTTSRAEDIAATHPMITTSGYVSQQTDPQTGRIVFDRKLASPSKGYQWDSPGTRIRFRTDATRIGAKCHYSDRHSSKTARNPIGRVIVDGTLVKGWQFTTPTRQAVRPVEDVVAKLPIPPGGGFHDYELVLPYGDSVEFAGLEVNEGARFEPPAPAPATRYVALGDSVTHGFESSSIDHSYPFLVGQSQGWETINLGIGGRRAVAVDGKLAASLKPDVISVHIGVNNWQGGGSLDDYRANLKGMLANIRRTCPDVPVYFITPLWVRADWKPQSATMDLDAYRQVMREVVEASGDTNLHLIEGPSLIDAQDELFSRTAVHPNDAGFAMMAERLSAAMSAKQP